MTAWVTDGEIDHNLNPNSSVDASGNADSDGLTNIREAQLGTDPRNPDTDGDDMSDGWEVEHGFSPLDPTDADEDADGDGYTNRDEFLSDTDPHLYVLTLKKGWNLVSISRKPRDNSVGAILGDKIIGYAWAWANGTYTAATELLPNQGYWVYCPADCTIAVLLP